MPLTSDSSFKSILSPEMHSSVAGPSSLYHSDTYQGHSSEKYIVSAGLGDFTYPNSFTNSAEGGIVPLLSSCLANMIVQPTSQILLICLQFLSNALYHHLRMILRPKHLGLPITGRQATRPASRSESKILSLLAVIARSGWTRWPASNLHLRKPRTNGMPLKFV